MRRSLLSVLILTALFSAGLSAAPVAQDKKTAGAAKVKASPAHKPKKPAAPADPISQIPAKVLFGAKAAPAAMSPRPIGFYANGCLAGATALPINGRTWQVMRLSRNRNWGLPVLVRYLERTADKAAKVGWPGLLVGDMSQPRGGPMVTGHASHQIGLDADIWFTPMPDHELTKQEREEWSAMNVVADNKKYLNPDKWTPAHAALIRTAAEDPEILRVFVNAAIKKELCQTAGSNRAWLSKIRPWWGHDDHLHIRLRCPAGVAECKGQDPPGAGDGCGKELDFWFSDAVLHPKPPKVASKPRPPMTLAALPPACRQVLAAP
jgi:penicillin-insensitive murein endopeptidase